MKEAGKNLRRYLPAVSAAEELLGVTESYRQGLTERKRHVGKLTVLALTERPLEF